MNNNINPLEENQFFYIGQKVIAVSAIQGSYIKNGTIYRVYSYEYVQNGSNGWFWYIGVENNSYKSHDRLRPSIFVPIIDNDAIEEVNEQFITNWNNMFKLRQLQKKLSI